MTETSWLVLIQTALNELKEIPWFQPDGNPDPAWRLSPTRREAWNASLDATRGNERNAGWYAVWSDLLHIERYAERDDAEDVAWHAAQDVAQNATRHIMRHVEQDVVLGVAYDVEHDVELFLRVTVVYADLPIAQGHRDFVEATMNVWRKGYGLLCDMDGVLYVYEQVEAQS